MQESKRNSKHTKQENFLPTCFNDSAKNVNLIQRHSCNFDMLFKYLRCFDYDTN